MNTPDPAPYGTYTPGYSWAKLAYIAAGLALLAASSLELVPNLTLLLTGERASAESVAVIKQQIGTGNERVLSTEKEVDSAMETRDRSFVFWNEYRFTGLSGATHTFRAPSGGILKPPKPLLDRSGLPTSVLICYNPKSPEKVMLPLEQSTWFFSGGLALWGLVAILYGSLFFIRARTPIPLPHIEGVNDLPAAPDRHGPG
ncbi:MAG: hypothetical protein ACOYM3_13305 [Terrimicrobiaceae bacterium]